MAVRETSRAGFWKRLWLALTGGAAIEPVADLAEPVIVMAAPVALDPPVVLNPPLVAHTGFGSGAVFGLSARLASTSALNPPVQRREGKAAVVPRELKVGQGIKAKPKAVEAVVKKSRPNRHVWLSSRPQPQKTADIIKFVPRSQRAGAKRAA